jgi:putative peptidoglycan lipid II flippase
MATRPFFLAGQYLRQSGVSTASGSGYDASAPMSVKATGKVSLAVMASRVFGLLREMLFAGLFGGSRWMDCFYLAFKVPKLLRDLFAEGALSQAFVTTFSKKLKSGETEAAWALAHKIITLAAVFMGAVTLIGIGIAPWIVELLTSLSRVGAAPRAYAPEEIAFTVTLVRIMYPFILLVSLAALAMGILNARNVFGMPALSSCFFNLASMASGAALGGWIDPTWGKDSLHAFAIGVVIGGMAQLVCQFPSLTRVGLRFAIDFRWRDSGVRKVLGLMGPAVIAASVVQVNVLVNAMFAFGVGEGAVSWLSYAFRLMQFPIGVFGVAVATVTLPALSRAAVEHVGVEFRETLGKGMRLVAFLVLPSTIGLIVMAEPIVSVLYERGAFDAADRLQTAGALQAYACGLLFYAWLKVLQPAFYAMDRRWLPMMVSVLSLFTNAGLNAVFVFVMRWGHESLALTTSISATLNFMILYLAMHRVAGGIGTKDLAVLMGKLSIAGGVMAAACVVANHWFFADPVSLPIWTRAGALLAVIGVAVIVYFSMTALLRVKETRDALTMLRRRIGG